MELRDLIVETLENKKANDVVSIDFDNNNPLCDYFVIADAPSFRQINALSDDIEEVLEKNNYPIKSIQKSDNSEWILIDAADVVVHIFLSEERSRYSLEKLYQDYAQKEGI